MGIWLIGSQETDLHGDLHTLIGVQDGICTGIYHRLGHKDGICTGICTLTESRVVFAHLWGHKDGICTGIWLIGSQCWDLHEDLHTYGVQEYDLHGVLPHEGSQ